MRIAALYDIHGNLPALEAVITEIRAEGVDHVVVGGDVVPGPMPRETLDCLLGLDVRMQFIQGNGEVAVLQQISGKTPANVPGEFQEIIRWTATELGAEQESLLASWSMTFQLNIPGLGEVLFCHATPRNENELFTRLTPESRVSEIFRTIRQKVVVCGHTHIQFDRMIGNVRVINSGSVGMPFGKPGADWLLLGSDVQLRHTSYDLEKAAARIRGTSYPQAEKFAARYILDPPSEQEMLAVFAKSDLT
jgi:predicted phosphodiesterase